MNITEEARQRHAYALQCLEATTGPIPVRTRFTVRWGCVAASIMAGALTAVLASYILVELTPCETEDSAWCHWSAATQGNGDGASFTTYWDGFTVRT